MSNLINNQFNNLRLEINYGDYWDFFLNNEPISLYPYDDSGKSLYDKCLISYIDSSDKECIDGKDLLSKRDYFWNDLTIVPHKLYNVGYTGVDNGLIPFERDRVLNKEFLEIYQHSAYDINEDIRLKLHPINGGTKIYEYPTSIENGLIKLNGGFYQGFFMTDCEKYQLFPNKLDNGDVWHFEFVLNKTEFEKESEKTLNDKYYENKGIFFYIGTRAENKWDYLYNWDDKNLDYSKDECFLDLDVEFEEEKDVVIDNPIDEYVSYDYINDINHTNTTLLCPQCKIKKFTYFDLFEEDDEFNFKYENVNDYVAPELDIRNFEFKTNEGFVIGRNIQTYLDTDNKFLMFDRTCNGYTTDDYKEGDIVRYIHDKNDFKGNLFLLMDRTCNGYTTDNIDKLRDTFKSKYNVIADIVQNALSFRITDDGKIGYRYLVQDCDSEKYDYKILEGYSKKGIIQENNWHVINVRVRGFFNTMVLEFYVDGKLVFLTNEMPKLNLRKLNDLNEKQETVPYNISLGGGTQGLCDTILPNYMLDPYRVYPLEKHFGGSFIGYMKKFRFYNCKMNFNDILNNYRFEMRNK